ncbi:chitin-binding type-2 domain-containing protein [Nephila pilipes]|uniref:Chitin-binding type-2 domain-containing protein n=1 Tax=Nephila pilipes TaxID=299642 RepID=A0A8X6QP13_NEPPI|nr:chitin-binding type-2 domain-containing protein [Nephila pilipes]
MNSGIKRRVVGMFSIIITSCSLDSFSLGQDILYSLKMKLCLALLFVSGLALSAAASRSKRAAYDLPDGAELLVGAVRTSFVCNNEGYYADIDNNCQIFHVCHTVTHADGKSDMLQWSFLCGNQTIFNQFSFTCTSPEDAVPCGSASDFFYLNGNIHAGPNVFFHNEQDVARAAAVTPGRSSQPVYVPPAGGAPRPPQRPFRG